MNPFFDKSNYAPWCPLFGAIPPITPFPNSLDCQAARIITEARFIWGVFDGFIPPLKSCWPDPWELPNYPEEKILSARGIFRAMVSIEQYSLWCEGVPGKDWFETSSGDYKLVQSLDDEKSLKLALYIARNSIDFREVSCKISDAQIIAIFAIANAWSVLKNILFYGENEQNSGILEKIRLATHLLGIADSKNSIDEQKNIETLRRSKGGSSPKRLDGILLAIKIIMLSDIKKQSFSAERLWNYFETNHKGIENALLSRDYKIYFGYENENTLKELLYQIFPNGRKKSIGRSAFNGYVRKAKKD